MPEVLFTQYSQDDDTRCRLCGKPAKLSFEHVPPRRCYNNSSVMLRTIRNVVLNHSGMQTFRRGVGVRSLCEGCNTRTGDLYGSSFASFNTQAMAYTKKLSYEGTALSLPFTSTPLLVAKQLAVMLVSMSREYTLKIDRFNRLRSLIEHPAAFGPPPDLDFWIYLMREGDARLTGMSVPMMHGGLMPYVWCEVALPPMGYVMTSGEDANRVAMSLGLCNVTWFLDRPLKGLETVFMPVPLRKPVGSGPLEYAR